MMTVAVIGKYPRVPAPPGEPGVREIAAAFAAGQITAEEREERLTAVARWVMADMRDAGADLGTDGLVRWDDPWTGFTRGVRGFTLGRRVQEFGTNTLYRLPVATAPLQWEGPVTLAAYRAALALAPPGYTLIPFLPGPHALAHAGDAAPSVYGSPLRFVEACAQVLQNELRFLLEEAPRVFVAEPSLAGPNAFLWSHTGFRILCDGLDSRRVILLTWGGWAPLPSTLPHLPPFGGVGIDFVAHPDSWQMLEDLPKALTVYAGVVDATSAVVERPEDLAPFCRRLAQQGRPLVLCPNRHFTVPRRIAAAKLRTLRTLGDSL